MGFEKLDIGALILPTTQWLTTQIKKFDFFFQKQIEHLTAVDVSRLTCSATVSSGHCGIDLKAYRNFNEGAAK